MSSEADTKQITELRHDVVGVVRYVKVQARQKSRVSSRSTEALSMKRLS